MVDDKINRLLSKDAYVKMESPVKEATIQSVGDLVRIVECAHFGDYQYRGQRCITWPLLPSLTRSQSPCSTGLAKNESCQDKELHILREFKTRVKAYKQLVPRSELELAILAQHHGASTRLLDWTMNPLAALYFAVEQDDDPLERNEIDAVIWAAKGHRHRVADFEGCTFNQLGEGVHFVIPDYDENRAAVQSSLLAVWANPFEPMNKVANPEILWKIIVPHRIRAPIKWMLHCIGINRETLFPDLDGLGGYLAWKHRRIYQEDYIRSGIPEPK